LLTAISACGAIPASKLACRKAAASRRTPKQRIVATIKSLWSPSPEPATGLRSFRNCGLTAPEAVLHLTNRFCCLSCATWWRRQIFSLDVPPLSPELALRFYTHWSNLAARSPTGFCSAGGDAPSPRETRRGACETMLYNHPRLNHNRALRRSATTINRCQPSIGLGRRRY
jgi:hypothetical protein